MHVGGVRAFDQPGCAPTIPDSDLTATAQHLAAAMNE
jgi:hypothetical protein